MKTHRFLAVPLILGATLPAHAAEKERPAAEAAKTAVAPEYFKPEMARSEGTVTIGAKKIDYQAVAGTLIVHPKNWDDAAPKAEDADKNPPPEASMFYTAYFKKGEKPGTRPVTFLYNGGPGSATVWLHMGAFGPKRVVTANDMHTPAAPYRVVNNDTSLLDASDLVFIDAPGAGFSRVSGKDKEKAFWGVDADAYAFSSFITQFLGKYGLWNAPKYLFGESYGTTRSAVVAQVLQQDFSVDLNGVILLSQILNFSLDGDYPQFNPGVDTPYTLMLPTYAATAWYHHKLPNQPGALEPFLKEVEAFATGEYTLALAAGSSLSAERRDAIAGKLHEYTGLPADYIKKANLRINGGMFEKNLQDDQGVTTGRLDTRFSGPTLDPLSREAEYDPQSSAISSAYVSAFNDYVRKELRYGEGKAFKPYANVFPEWDMKHTQPGMPFQYPGVANVMPDLSVAMKQNPNLKILLTGGYYDLATPYFQGIYEMRHLGIPSSLQANISYKYYPSGHMVYANDAARIALHADVMSFIRQTANLADSPAGK